MTAYTIRRIFYTDIIKETTYEFDGTREELVALIGSGTDQADEAMEQISAGEWSLRTAASEGDRWEVL